MEKTVNISVIIPTYNRKDTLKTALNSVLEQTSQPMETIVVDDGSTDDTKKLIHSQYPDVVYFYQENTGVSAARNTGIRIANGEWLAFLDSDDSWKPDKLEKHIQFIKNHPELRISQTDEIWIRHGKFVNPMKKHKKPSGWIFVPSLELCLVSPSCVMIKKTLFDDIGMFDESLPVCEDYDLWLRISAFEQIGLLDDKLTIKTGGHDNQLSRTLPAMDRFRVKAIEKILKHPHLKDEYRAAALDTLTRKCTILINGYTKRGNVDMAHYFEKIMNLYRTNHDV